MSNDFDVVVVGGANMDFLVHGTSLPTPGSTIPGDEFQEAPGGKGANQAVAAARLGATVALVSRVGADPRGEAIIAKLRAEGVDVGEVLRDRGAATGVALVMVGTDGEKQIMTAPGANLELGPEDVTRAAALISRARVVVLQLEIPIIAVETAIWLARDAGVRIVLDPAPPQALPEHLLRHLDVIRSNAIEAEVLTGIPVTDQSSAKKAAEILLARGVRAAVVGAPGGNLLLSRGMELWLPHVDVDVVDATGAGDAFSAALAVCLARGADLAVAARFANAAAAQKTTKLGAQAGLPRSEEVGRLLLQSEPAASPV